MLQASHSLHRWLFWFGNFGFLLLFYLNYHFATRSWSEISGYVFWVSSVPQNTWFKLRHLVQYTPQTLCFCLFLQHFYAMRVKNPTLVCAIVYGFIGVTSEAMQVTNPTRFFSFLDILWNLTAIALGLGLYRWYQRYRAG